MQTFNFRYAQFRYYRRIVLYPQRRDAKGVAAAEATRLYSLLMWDASAFVAMATLFVLMAAFAARSPSART